EHVGLDHYPDVHLVALAQQGDAIEDRLTVLVAGEIVVGDEEVADPVGPVLADRPLYVVRGAAPRLSTLDIDDDTKRALIGAAAARIEAGERLDDPLEVLARQDRGRFRLERRQ